ERLGAGPHRLGALRAVGGEDDDRQAGMAFLEPRQHRRARRRRYLPVEQHELGTLRLDQVEGDLSVARLGDLELVRRERPAQEAADEDVVVDEQDPRRAVARGPGLSWVLDAEQRVESAVELARGREDLLRCGGAKLLVA